AEGSVPKLEHSKPSCNERSNNRIDRISCACGGRANRSSTRAGYLYRGWWYVGCLCGRGQGTRHGKNRCAFGRPLCRLEESDTVRSTRAGERSGSNSGRCGVLQGSAQACGGEVGATIWEGSRVARSSLGFRSMAASSCVKEPI